jgi:putative NIF3 family GTP cyclohydrolase 1 type 2
MTAKDVLDLMKKNLGGPWNENTYRDVFHAGDGNVEVKGIATTFMSTLDLLQRAHAAGLNMVIPHETTFWNDRDETRSSPTIPSTSSKPSSARRTIWSSCDFTIVHTRTAPISSW